MLMLTSYRRRAYCANRLLSKTYGFAANDFHGVNPSVAQVKLTAVEVAVYRPNPATGGLRRYYPERALARASTSGYVRIGERSSCGYVSTNSDSPEERLCACK